MRLSRCRQEQELQYVVFCKFLDAVLSKLPFVCYLPAALGDHLQSGSNLRMIVSHPRLVVPDCGVFLGASFQNPYPTFFSFFHQYFHASSSRVFAGQKVIGEAIASGLALDESKMWDPDFKTAAQYVLFSKPLRAMLPGYVFRFLGGSV
jgi:hypothetical protein